MFPTGLPVPAAPQRRTDLRLARVVHIGTAMIAAYGPLRAARFMVARGVPSCVLVPVLRLGDRRRHDTPACHVLPPRHDACHPAPAQGIPATRAPARRERETT